MADNFDNDSQEPAGTKRSVKRPSRFLSPPLFIRAKRLNTAEAHEEDNDDEELPSLPSLVPNPLMHRANKNQTMPGATTVTTVAVAAAPVATAITITSTTATSAAATTTAPTATTPAKKPAEAREEYWTPARLLAL